MPNLSTFLGSLITCFSIEICSSLVLSQYWAHKPTFSFWSFFLWLFYLLVCKIWSDLNELIGNWSCCKKMPFPRKSQRGLNFKQMIVEKKRKSREHDLLQQEKLEQQRKLEQEQLEQQRKLDMEMSTVKRNTITINCHRCDWCDQ